MATLQSTYNENIGVARFGMIVSGKDYNADTFIAGDATDIPFGRGVKRATAADQCTLGVDAAGSSPYAVTNFVGVTVKDPTQAAEKNAYAQGRHAAVMYEGEIWVEADGAVSAGDDVTVNTTTGRFGTKSASSAQGSVPGAIFLSAASNGGLARLRLTGETA